MRIPFEIIVCVPLLACSCDRSAEFSAQAENGKPIIQAIHAYQADAGHLPDSLSALSPKYISPITDLPDPLTRKHAGWDYKLVTNGQCVSFVLRYYMGKGGVEYVSSNWIGNDEGTKTILFTQ